MAKKKANKNRSARQRAQLRKELKKREEQRLAETDKELKSILGCLIVAFALLATVLIFAHA
jgi:cell division protein FtsL